MFKQKNILFLMLVLYLILPQTQSTQTCDIQSYLDTTSTPQSCKTCESAVLYCKRCNLLPSGVNCTKCDTSVLANRILSGACHTCGANQYLFNQSHCIHCNNKIPNCDRCSPYGDICYTCSSGQLNNGYCSNCNSTSYQSINNCVLCNASIPNCESCLNGSSCRSCILSSNTELVGGQCISCNSSSFFDSGNSVCKLCSSVLSNCDQCSDRTTCLICFTQFILSHGKCYSCNSTSYFNNTLDQCFECSTKLFQCEFCSIYGDICLSCFIMSFTELINGICTQCNSSSYFDTLFCKLCSTNLDYCENCSSDGLSCTYCILGSQTQLYNGSCVMCNSSSYFDDQHLKCVSCSNYLTQCNQCQKKLINVQCIVCSNISYLENGVCLPTICSNPFLSNCQLCPTNVCLKCKASSQTFLVNGHCQFCTAFQYFNSEDETCRICSSGDNSSNNEKCNLIEGFEKIMDLTSAVISFPTINIITNTLIQLFATIDDFSYYSYHNYSYFQPLKQRFESTFDVAYSRFFPPYFSSIYNLLRNTNIVSKKNNQLYTYNLKGQDVYFLNNTLLLWIGNFPLSIIVFTLFSFIHWILNKYVKNGFFKPYNYAGMIIVNLFGGNIQYLSFRCFSNLHQIRVIQTTDYLNIICCYLVLLLIIVYSIIGLSLFHIIYDKVKYQYISDDLFDSASNIAFVLYNLLKILTGFIHAYFYFNPLLQSILLGISYFVKCSIASIVFYFSSEKRTRFSSQVLVQVGMVIMQTLIIIEQFNRYFDYQNKILYSLIGTYEIVLLLIMISNKIMITVIELFKTTIIYIISKIWQVNFIKRYVKQKQTHIFLNRSNTIKKTAFYKSSNNGIRNILKNRTRLFQYNLKHLNTQQQPLNTEQPQAFRSRNHKHQTVIKAKAKSKTQKLVKRKNRHILTVK